MPTYFSTFTTGLHEIIPEVMKSKLGVLQIIHLSDGLVIYNTNASWQIVRDLPFFTNSFILIKSFKHSNLNSLYQWTIGNCLFVKHIKSFFAGHRTSVRIMASVNNQTITIRDVVRKQIEHELIQNRDIVIDRQNPKFEIWFIERADGTCLIGIRFTTHSKRQDIPKGELHPEIIYAMNYLSDPSDKDIFLDPFCGSGVIPIQRAQNFPYTRIIASDTDTNLIKGRLKLIKRKLHDFDVIQEDATKLKSIKNNSINKIVSDPPWGMYKKDNNLMKLYSDFINEAARVLRPNSLMILLTAQKEMLEPVIREKKQDFEIIGNWNILVSGKKAGIYKVKRH